MTKKNPGWDLDAHVILEVVHGSHAYGLNTPESDLDLRGVAVPPLSEYFGIGPPWEQTVQTSPVDRTVWNIQKFVSLAGQNNPNVLEVLAVPEDCVRSYTSEGLKLLEAQQRFLSQKIEKSFMGYAKSQFFRMERNRRWLRDPPVPGKSYPNDFETKEGFDEYLKDLVKYEEWKTSRNPKRQAMEAKCGYDAKHFSHCLRLCLECIEAFNTGYLTVRLDESDREFLLAAKQGDLPYDGLLERFYTLEVQCQEAALANRGNLPKEPDWSYLDALCIDLTRSFLKV